MIDIEKFRSIALKQVGKPYQYGSKWDIKDPDPQGPVDCSGFVRWIYAQLGISIIDGSMCQYESSVLLNPQSLAGPIDLGFFKRPNSPTHHVGMILDKDSVIEARGEPFDSVILRPRYRWEAWKEFTGWMRPKVLVISE